MPDSSTRKRILLTGAGGAAAVSFIKAVAQEPVDLYAADMDPFAAGLYLVPPSRRHILRAGADPEFVPALLDYCRQHRIDVLVPTVDLELLPIALAREAFERLGVRLLLASEATLRICLDKHALLTACSSAVQVGDFAILDEAFSPEGWEFPLIAKPRSGSGSRGIVIVHSPEELDPMTRDGSLLIQEYLPGEEYSVDVLAAGDGRVLAAVPRLRMKVDSGIAVTATTLHDATLENAATAVAEHIGLSYTANIQFRRSRSGVPTLLEVNPRFPGTMPLTVKAGVNMPLISLRDVLGESPADGPMPFDDLAVVRFWAEEFIQPEEIEVLRREAR